MKTEDQVCTLEQAQRLEELGVRGPSLLYWWRWSIPEAGDEYDLCTISDLHEYRQNALLHPEDYSAFTTAELGIMLPKGYCSGNGVLSNSIKWCDKVSYTGNDVTFLNDTVVTSGPTEAIARASMLITLLESGELTTEEVNASLA